MAFLRDFFSQKYIYLCKITHQMYFFTFINAFIARRPPIVHYRVPQYNCRAPSTSGDSASALADALSLHPPGQGAHRPAGSYADEHTRRCGERHGRFVINTFRVGRPLPGEFGRGCAPLRR